MCNDFVQESALQCNHCALSTPRLEEDEKADEGQAKLSAEAMFQTKDRTGQSEVADDEAENDDDADGGKEKEDQVRQYGGYWQQCHII